MDQNTLRGLLVRVTAFQQWIGASGGDLVARAKERIHLVNLPPPVSEDGYTVAELKEPRPLSVYLPRTAGGGSVRSTRGASRTARTRAQRNGPALFLATAVR